jgi:endonuclease/exonuclease/phosphatase family metal-dependent hydrolase
MKFWFLLVLLPLTSFAQDLKVMTWNTFLIPPPWNSTKQADRTDAMLELLPTLDHDVMFFQEAFYDSKRKDLIEGLKKTHPHSVVPKKGKKLKQIQDSGLFMVSKYPMEKLDQIIFNDCAKADCISSKSAVLVEITLPNGKKAQLINTHMQAWDEPKTVEIRKKQLLQIKEMMAKNLKPGVPQILIGDLNIDGNIETEYKPSLEMMEMTSTPLEGPLTGTNGFSTEGCFKKPGGDKEEWLDHMWLKANGSDAKVTSKKVLLMNGELDCGPCPLSDHRAVEAVIKL